MEPEKNVSRSFQTGKRRESTGKRIIEKAKIILNFIQKNTEGQKIKQASATEQ